MNKLLEGKKTYIGLALALFGALGGSELISEGELTSLLTAIFEIAGILFAAYGRFDAKRRTGG